MAPRRGNRPVFGRRRRSEERLDDATARVRSEARAAAKRERAELQRARAQARRDELGLRARGAALEVRRRLRPLGRAFGPFGSLLRGWMGRIAPYFSKALMLMVSLPAALIALLLRLSETLLGSIGARAVPAARATARFLSIHVRPAGTVAFVAAAAAVALVVSQFFDYSGVAVSASLYAGEVGTTAPVPLTALEHAGGAHLWVLVPVAIAALLLTFQTVRGSWRLGRLVGLLGLLGVLVSLAIDLPQGLDAGRAGTSYSDTQAELLQGFWAQLSASVVLLFSGPLLGVYVRRASPAGRTREPSRRLGRPFGRRSRRKARPVVATRGEARF
jgi:hypothetical protein